MLSLNAFDIFVMLGSISFAASSSSFVTVFLDASAVREVARIEFSSLIRWMISARDFVSSFLINPT